MHQNNFASSEPCSASAAFGGGAVIGALGGLIGLGGAEFRLPLLIGLFRFGALEAVILNKAMSLVVVATALPFRARTVPFDEIAAHWPVILNLLAGSLLGAWFGAGWATRLRSETLCKVIAGLLVVIAAVLVLGHDATTGAALVTGSVQIVAGVIAGFAIGVVASLLGRGRRRAANSNLGLAVRRRHQACWQPVAGGEPPDHDRRFTRYSRDQSFSVIGRNRAFLLVMAAGSIIGTFIGGQLLGIMPSGVLLPLLL